MYDADAQANSHKRNVREMWSLVRRMDISSLGETRGQGVARPQTKQLNQVAAGGLLSVALVCEPGVDELF